MADKIVKFRTINHDIFAAIKDGSKSVETRAATAKYQGVKIGDTLILICGREKIKKEVKSVEFFKTIDALLKKYKPQTINPKLHSIKEAKEMWFSFPGYKEKIKKFGLVAWRLK